MGVRTLCFLATVFTHGPTRWVFFTAALLLPYFAVVIANGGREQDRATIQPVVLPSRTELPPLHPSAATRTPDSPASQKRSRNTF
jgi:hypothetical protein